MSEHKAAVDALTAAGFVAAAGAPHDEHDGTVVDVTLLSKDWAAIERAKEIAAEEGCEVRFVIETAEAAPDEPSDTPEPAGEPEVPARIDGE